MCLACVQNKFHTWRGARRCGGAAAAAAGIARYRDESILTRLTRLSLSSRAPATPAPYWITNRHIHHRRDGVKELLSADVTLNAL